MPHAEKTRPLVIRLIRGDIAQVRASLIVVNHFNGLPPTGAEAAVDEALGRILSRRAAQGALDGHFAATTFYPAVNSSLAATAVLVVGLGDAGRFSEKRLPEVGAAIVQAVAETGFREVATIVHGAGSADVDPGKAAHLLVSGLLDAMTHVPGAECLRELMIVEYPGDACASERMDQIAEGIQEASGPARIHCFFERAPDLVGPASVPRAPSKPEAGIPEHLQLSIRTEYNKLRLTLIGDNPLDCEATYPCDPKLVTKIQRRLTDEVLNVYGDAEAREKSLEGIGNQLFQAFFLHKFANGKLCKPETSEKILVLGIEGFNSDLPWELLHNGAGFLTRRGIVSRSLCSHEPARPAPASPSDPMLRILVVSPTYKEAEGRRKCSLPAAARETDWLVSQLKNCKSVTIEYARGPHATYDHVSSLLEAGPWDIFHYAGHFQLDPMHIGDSGLVLTGRGLLTTNDLGTRRWVPRFFFCNACESARISDTLPVDPASLPFSPPGLVEALLQRGVQAFLGSLWKVNDNAAKTFALAFYQSVFDGIPLGGSVRGAREAVCKKHGAGEHAWAGYALFGPPWLSLAIRP